MANQLTKRVMARIVERCGSYEPLKESDINSSLPHSRPRPSNIGESQEALLKGLIHHGRGKVEMDSDSLKCKTENQSTKQDEKPFRLEDHSRKNGVISLDALIKEIKK